MRKVALLFPGQGSQYVGMGKDLCNRFEIAKHTFEEANDILKFDLKKLCFEGNIEELTKTVNTQPALLTASVAAFRVFMDEIRLQPDFLAGHSLGEISALTCAGGIQFSDALKIVRERGRCMQGSVSGKSGAMAAIVGVDSSIVNECCNIVQKNGGIVVVSNYNSPEQTVISGSKEAVNEVSRRLTVASAKVVPLKVSAPFHSPLMQPVADIMREELMKYTYSPLRYPVLSNVTARPYESHNNIVENLSNQIIKAVQWKTSIQYLERESVFLAIEIGPQTVLKNLMGKNTPRINAFSFDKENDIQKLKDFVSANSGIKTETGKNLKFITQCITYSISTRNRNWNNDEYQNGVVVPYREIQKMHDKIKQENREPTLEEMNEVLKLLSTIFNTKRIPNDEKVKLFDQLFHDTGTRHLFNNFINHLIFGVSRNKS